MSLENRRKLAFSQVLYYTTSELFFKGLFLRWVLIPVKAM